MTESGLEPRPGEPLAPPAPTGRADLLLLRELRRDGVLDLVAPDRDLPHPAGVVERAEPDPPGAERLVLASIIGFVRSSK